MIAHSVEKRWGVSFVVAVRPLFSRSCFAQNVLVIQLPELEMNSREENKKIPDTEDRK